MPTAETRSGAAGPGQYLIFLVAGDEYAAPVSRLREVVSFPGATRVPAAPACIRGVMNLRGRVVPVVDLAVKLGQPEAATTRWTCVLLIDVLIDGEPVTLGLLTERVGHVIELAEDDLRPAPAFGSRVRAEYLAGLGRCAQRLLPLLDLERMLSLEELLGAAPRATAAADDGGQPGFDAGPRR